MRDPIKNITILQKQLNELQLENQLLKNILDRSGISYVQELKLLKEPEFTESFDPDQGARIRHPREITEKMVKVFLTYFGGALMLMLSVRKRNLEKPATIRSVIISGRKCAHESME